MARGEHEPQTAAHRLARRQEGVEHGGLLLGACSRHDDGRFPEAQKPDLVGTGIPGGRLHLQVSGHHDAPGSRRMIRRASSSDCMQKRATPSSTRRKSRRTSR